MTNWPEVRLYLITQKTSEKRRNCELSADF
jgi:hypothetical protein